MNLNVFLLPKRIRKTNRRPKYANIWHCNCFFIKLHLTFSFRLTCISYDFDVVWFSIPCEYFDYRQTSEFPHSNSKKKPEWLKYKLKPFLLLSFVVCKILDFISDSDISIFTITVSVMFVLFAWNGFYIIGAINTTRNSNKRRNLGNEPILLQ